MPTRRSCTVSYSLVLMRAQGLGIPQHALPKLPEQPTAHDIQEAKSYLTGMLESYLSACI